MAIEVPVQYAFISVNGVDLSNHARRIALNVGQETQDASAFGSARRQVRPGAGAAPRVEAEFFNDHASGSVESTIRALVGSTSAGVTVIVQPKAGSATNPTGTSNPKYTITAVPDGDIMSMDHTYGELPILSIALVSYDGALTVSTSATS